MTQGKRILIYSRIIQKEIVQKETQTLRLYTYHKILKCISYYDDINMSMNKNMFIFTHILFNFKD